MADDIAPSKLVRDVADDAKNIGDAARTGVDGMLNAGSRAIQDVVGVVEQGVSGVLNTAQTAGSNLVSTGTAVIPNVINDGKRLLDKGKAMVDDALRSLKPPEPPRIG